MSGKTFKIDMQLLKVLLTTEKFGNRIYDIDTVDSTNNKARKVAESGGKEGTIIVARKQVKGRGRLDRKWQSPLGGLWFSIILRPPVKNPTPLTVIFGAAVSMALESQVSIPCRFHWPNDILINEKKVGGILLESKFKGDEVEYVIAGIGINVNFHAHQLSGDLLVEPTTIMDERQEPTPMSALFASILNKLEKTYFKFLNQGPGPLIERYKNRCITIGRRVKIINSGEIAEADATALDLSDDGGLLVELFSGGKGILYNAERLILLEDYSR